ncbi:MAG: hypothetical protein EOO01_31665 [Chitinophagaceae bacterium]|nr:MAG: hypothetical protein EOO01_31665 [Chitinophagaceae bacterium]
MESKEKQYILLKWGLTLKRIVERNKTLVLDKKAQGIKDKNILNSFGRLEAASGIPKATLVNISLGRKNAATTTWMAILDALDMTLADFAKVFDSIRDSEVQHYREELDKARKERVKAKTTRRKKPTGN